VGARLHDAGRLCRRVRSGESAETIEILKYT
jgi:hypothetical protein